MNDITSTLATNIKHLREKAGLTQDELSDKAGVAYSTIAKLEQGAIKNPTLTTIWSIAQSLSVTLDELLEISDKPSVAKSSNSKIKFVYFDMNGVLVRFYHRAFSMLARKTGQPIDKVESIFWHYNVAGNRGDISLEEFNKYFSEQLGEKVEWEDYYMDAVEGVKEAHKLIADIRHKYKIGLFTNTFPGFVNKLIHIGKLPDMHFDEVVDSSVVGAVKPEKAIYELAQTRSGVKPEEILFIDDSRDNLVAAEQFGWSVMWFDGYRPDESVKRIREILE